MALLHIADYVIFGLSIVASFAISIYFACRKDKNQSTEDYLVASRQMSVIPVATSLLVSILSAISLLGTCSEVYYFGIEALFTVLAFAISATINNYTFVPLFHRLKLTSVHEVSVHLPYCVNIITACLHSLCIFKEDCELIMSQTTTQALNK